MDNYICECYVEGCKNDSKLPNDINESQNSEYILAMDKNCSVDDSKGQNSFIKFSSKKSGKINKTQSICKVDEAESLNWNTSFTYHSLSDSQLHISHENSVNDQSYEKTSPFDENLKNRYQLESPKEPNNLQLGFGSNHPNEKACQTYTYEHEDKKNTIGLDGSYGRQLFKGALRRRSRMYLLFTFTAAYLVLLLKPINISRFTTFSISLAFEELLTCIDYTRCVFTLAQDSQDDAIMCYEALVSQDKFKKYALLDLGYLQNSAGNHWKAKDALEKYLIYANNDIRGLMEYNKALIKLGEVDDAIFSLYRILEVDSVNVFALESLFRIYKDLQKHRTLIGIILKLKDVKGWSKDYLRTLANSYIKVKELKEAKAVLYKYCILIGRDVYFLNNYGLIAYNYGNYNESLELLEEAVNIYPHSSIVTLNRTLLSYNTNNINDFNEKSNAIIDKGDFSPKEQLIYAWIRFLAGYTYDAYWLFKNILNNNWSNLHIRVQAQELIDHTFNFYKAHGLHCNDNLVCIPISCYLKGLLTILIDDNAIINCKRDRANQLARLSNFIPKMTEMEYLE